MTGSSAGGGGRCGALDQDQAGSRKGVRESLQEPASDPADPWEDPARPSGNPFRRRSGPPGGPSGAGQALQEGVGGWAGLPGSGCGIRTPPLGIPCSNPQRGLDGAAGSGQGSSGPRARSFRARNAPAGLQRAASDASRTAARGKGRRRSGNAPPPFSLWRSSLSRPSLRRMEAAGSRGPCGARGPARRRGARRRWGSSPPGSLHSATWRSGSPIMKE